MSYTQVFGGATLYASQRSYLGIIFSADIDLFWPVEQQIAGSLIVASIMDLDATVPGLNVDLSDARQVSTGIQSVFTNIGANTFTVRDSVGGTIISVAPGEAWVVYLTSNATAAGTWKTFQLGATVSVSNASALAGAGLKAISTTLNQRVEVGTTAITPVNVVNADRAKLINYTGGVGVVNLLDPATVGADWWFMFRNSGSGDMTLTPAAGLIDGAATTVFSPGESSIVVCDGVNYFTVGFGQVSSSVFDFISIAVPGSGDFTLSGAQLDRISYRFTGILTGNRTIRVPNTTQQYWVDNQTTGAFTLAVGNVAQVGSPVVPQNDRAILYTDGVNVVNATTSSITFPITIAQGGTGGVTVGAAQTNLQVPPTSRLINTTAPLAGGGDLSADRTLTVAAANETAVGVAEIATQAEVNTGTDDTRIVTPLKLRVGIGTTIGAVKTADQSRNTTAVNADDSELVGFALQPSAEYVVEINLQFAGNGATANGWRFDVDYNGQGANVIVTNGMGITGQQTAPAAPAMMQFPAFNTKATFTTAGISETLRSRFGIVTNGSYVAGTAMDLRWAQGTSNATNTTLLAGSSVTVTRVA